MIRKDVVIAIIATFCLTASMFMVTTSKSQSGVGEYNPWADYNGDGTIDIFDIVPGAVSFGAEGDPTKNVNVTNWPDWTTNQPQPSASAVPLFKLYPFAINGTSYTIGVNATPPVGKTWHVSEFRFKSVGNDGYLRVTTKGVTQFDFYQAWINYLDVVKLPVNIRFNGDESIILEGKPTVPEAPITGFICIIGWEE